MRIVPIKSFNPFSRISRSLALPLALVAAGFLGGCLSRPPLIKQTFTFSAPPAISTNAPANAPVLEIRRVTVSPPYDSQTFAYRTGPAAYERDAYAQFLVPPADSLRAPIRRYLMNTGHFNDVISEGSAENPDLMLDVQVEQLYGDFRNKSAPTAVLDLRFTLYQANEGAPGKVLLRKEYNEQIPFHPPKATALMGAWNQALEKIMEKFTGDLPQSRG